MKIMVNILFLNSFLWMYTFMVLFHFCQEVTSFAIMKTPVIKTPDRPRKRGVYTYFPT